MPSFAPGFKEQEILIIGKSPLRLIKAFYYSTGIFKQ